MHDIYDDPISLQVHLHDVSNQFSFESGKYRWLE